METNPDPNSNSNPPSENPNPPQEPQESQNLVQTDIYTIIKKETVDQLMELGYEKIPSEHACLYNNSNLEQCLDWLATHINDPDINEPVTIQVNPEDLNKPQSAFSNLSPEEIKAKARELQEKARKTHEKKQKELEEEQERNRVRQVKELAKAKKLAEEQEMKLFVERQKKKKIEEENELRAMREQLARDKEERFGKKFDPNSGVALNSQKVYSKEENIFYYLKVIKTLYPPYRDSETLKNCYKTLKVILNNIIKNPNEEKFRKVKMTNPNVQERIGKIQLAIKTLNEIGFVEDGEFLTLKGNVDLQLLGKVVNYLGEEVDKID